VGGDDGAVIIFESMKEQSQILSALQIEQKLERMVHELIERLYPSRQFILVGIQGNGSVISERLAQGLQAVGDVEVLLMRLQMNKQRPYQEPPQWDGDVRMFKGKQVVLVDDVVHSGRTLMAAASFIMQHEPKSLTTVVLVDRYHRKYPIHADVVGLTLSTNLREHIEVDMGSTVGAYLVG
jgi:pyrimidine operon attenuation protein/uracil phosphoribosyltransferase